MLFVSRVKLRNFKSFRFAGVGFYIFGLQR